MIVALQIPRYRYLKLCVPFCFLILVFLTGYMVRPLIPPGISLIPAKEGHYFSCLQVIILSSEAMQNKGQWKKVIAQKVIKLPPLLVVWYCRYYSTMQEKIKGRTIWPYNAGHTVLVALKALHSVVWT